MRQSNRTATKPKIQTQINRQVAIILTFPVDVGILIFGLFIDTATQRMQAEIRDFEHETAVHHAVARLEITVRPDFRRMNVGHSLVVDIITTTMTHSMNLMSKNHSIEKSRHISIDIK